MKILYNYARYAFFESQRLNTQSAYEVGGFDKVYQCGVEDLPQDIYEQNKQLLDAPRGAGFWVWKSLIANKLLSDENIPEGSIIMYSDSGSVFINSVDHLIDVMDRDNLNIMVFRQNHRSRVFTKRDAFILTNSDTPEFTETQQYVGGWFLFRKNDFSRKFFAEYQAYALDPRIITNSPNTLDQPNYPGFLFHLEDESLTSIMSKKFNLYPYRNPSQHGFIDDVNFTHNHYGPQGKIRAEAEFGPMSTWDDKYGSYFHGESLDLHGGIEFDDRSTYPTILNLTRDKR